VVPEFQTGTQHASLVIGEPYLCSIALVRPGSLILLTQLRSCGIIGSHAISTDIFILQLQETLSGIWLSVRLASHFPFLDKIKSSRLEQQSSITN
jgi:hypothetical protein